jgi:hypothetical protein
LRLRLLLNLIFLFESRNLPGTKYLNWRPSGLYKTTRMKTCTKCKVEKDFSEFTNRQKSIDGKGSHCKECKKKEGEIYRAANKDKVKEARLNYVKSNPDKVKASKLKWQKNNPERVKAYRTKESYKVKKLERTRRWRADNPERVKEFEKKHREKHKEKRLDYAKKRYHEFLKYSDEYMEYAKKKAQNWYNENKDLALINQREYVKGRRNEIRERSKVHTMELRRWYVVGLLKSEGFTSEQINQLPGLLDVKKIEVIGKRFNKNKNKNK